MSRRLFTVLLCAALSASGMAATKAKPKARVKAAATAKKPEEKVANARLQGSRTNPFAAHSWLPPVRVVKAPPPPPPRAPALPFTYLGKMQDGTAVTVFVAQGERSHVLKNGDTLASYQVESITANDMTFVYLPLGEKQRLTFGTTN